MLALSLVTCTNPCSAATLTQDSVSADIPPLPTRARTWSVWPAATAWPSTQGRLSGEEGLTHLQAVKLDGGS